MVIGAGDAAGTQLAAVNTATSACFVASQDLVRVAVRIAESGGERGDGASQGSHRGGGAAAGARRWQSRAVRTNLAGAGDDEQTSGCAGRCVVSPGACWRGEAEGGDSCGRMEKGDEWGVALRLGRPRPGPAVPRVAAAGQHVVRPLNYQSPGETPLTLRDGSSSVIPAPPRGGPAPKLLRRHPPRRTRKLPFRRTRSAAANVVGTACTVLGAPLPKPRGAAGVRPSDMTNRFRLPRSILPREAMRWGGGSNDTRHGAAHTPGASSHCRPRAATTPHGTARANAPPRIPKRMAAPASWHCSGVLGVRGTTATPPSGHRAPSRGRGEPRLAAPGSAVRVFPRNRCWATGRLLCVAGTAVQRGARAHPRAVRGGERTGWQGASPDFHRC